MGYHESDGLGHIDGFEFNFGMGDIEDAKDFICEGLADYVNSRKVKDDFSVAIEPDEDFFRLRARNPNIPFFKKFDGNNSCV